MSDILLKQIIKKTETGKWEYKPVTECALNIGQALNSILSTKQNKRNPLKKKKYNYYSAYPT